MIAMPAPSVRLVADCPLCALMAEGSGCLEHTCPDCGAVSDVVCGTETTDQPTGGMAPRVECPVLNQVFASVQCHEDAHDAICPALG